MTGIISKSLRSNNGKNSEYPICVSKQWFLIDSVAIIQWSQKYILQNDISENKDWAWRVPEKEYMWNGKMKNIYKSELWNVVGTND